MASSNARSTRGARGKTTLYSPSGEKYSTADPAELTRLKARGYTTTRPKPAGGSKARSSSKTARKSSTGQPGSGTSSEISTPEA